MNSKTLSVCMIVKNEEKNIRRCLESIKDLADEIIVVDTGSTDKTMEIVNEYNCKTGFFQWNNNFSDARNASLELATMDWILFLDADEEISKEEGLRLKETINITSFEAFHCRLVNIIKNTNIGDAIVLRIFKNNPKYRFRGKMHEQIIFSIQEVSGEKSIGLSDIKILHYGYDPEVSDINLKQKRNLELLESYDEKDKNGYYYYSLGNEYSRIREVDKALDTYYKAFSNNYQSSYMPYLCLNIAKTLYSEKRYMETISECDRFTKIYPNLRDLYIIRALSCIDCSKFSEARKSIMNYFESELEEFIYPNSNFDSLYNLADMLTKVKRNCVKHPKNFLSALIVMHNQFDFVLNTIKSANEICDEVIVVIPKDNIVNGDLLKNIGATVVESSSSDLGECFMEGMRLCKCKYTLCLKGNEVLSLDSQKLLVNSLTENKDKIYFLNLIIENKETKNKVYEFRLFKNDDNLKKIRYFNAFIKYVESHNRQQANISIVTH